ncbi:MULTISPECIES: hypothetical protein [unclassified Mesorhizobium]|uniref:hypothetical protein n=1 Tax=unclassified Mesorhizobium TaxID=325217 RepID=UPI0003CF9457|nr:hypothetical protein [Mesorhizobium sp. LSJC264A00]ESX23896.1 hypothetical protein X767_13650 [Mesorhizobium sp. LSJC264A00]
MPKARRKSTQVEARRILAGLRLADGDLASQVMAASDNVPAVMMALMWLAAAWVEVEGAFRRLFVEHHKEWLAEIEPAKLDPMAALLEACRAIDATMRIMGVEPSAEQQALEARARALAEAELRRRGFFDESVPLEPV